jgi:tripartite-type tricarboxylate transporter receptor subunit TctC
MRLTRRAALAAPALLLDCRAGAQESWAPTRPLRLVIPFPPGGGSDVLGRLLAQRMGDLLGQPVVPENRSGAGGNIGADAVAKAPGDGHTMLLAANTFVVNPFLYRTLPFDLRRDFAAVARVAGTPMVVAAGPKLRERSLAELVQRIRSAPGAVNHGTAGIGTITHLAAELFEARTGGKLTHVHYRGTGPMITALVGGEIELAFTPWSSVEALTREGRLRVLAVTAPQRLDILPDVPTVAEAANLPGYEADIWFALLVPSATPRPAIARLAEAVRAAVEAGDGRSALAARGFSAAFAGPEEAARAIEAEQARLGPVIRAANISAE